MSVSPQDVCTVLCKSNANEIRRISFFVLPNFRARFRAISSEKFHLQTIFRPTFRRNIAGYFGRSNEKSVLRKFAEAKIRVATTVNKNLSDSEVVIHMASDYTAERTKLVVICVVHVY